MLGQTQTKNIELNMHKISLDKVLEISDSLNKLPKNNNKRIFISKQKAIKEMSKSIECLRKKNYTFEEIANTLTNNGLDISAVTLRNYMQRAKKTKTKKLAQPTSTISSHQPTNKTSQTLPKKVIHEDSPNL
jgi:hypothetical protein